MKIFQADINYINLDKLTSHFYEYYKELKKSGVILELTIGGELLWLEGVKKGIGKTTVLVLAESDNEIIGFGQGNLKLAPDYLGNLKIGVVSHFYVNQKYRGGNVASKIFQSLNDWFNSKNVHSVELQVLNNNIAAEKFWLRMGFNNELIQMRLIP